MKTAVAVAIAAIAAAGVGTAIYLVDIEQTEEARLPDVNLSVEGGNMPAFEAETGSIRVESEEVTVPVPNVEVTTEEETVTAPTLEIEPPQDEDVARAEDGAPAEDIARN